MIAQEIKILLENKKSKKKKFQHIQHSNIIKYRYRKQMAYNLNNINSININRLIWVNCGDIYPTI